MHADDFHPGGQLKLGRPLETPIHGSMLNISFAAVVLFSTFTVTACASDNDSNASWSAPTWMAQQEQAKDQFVARLQACMDAKGWNVTVDESAGIVEPLASESEMQRARQDVRACLTDQGIDPDSVVGTVTEESLREMYTQDLDTYECLLAQGVDMEQKPPSEDQFVEDGLAIQAGEERPDSWWPYGDPVILTMSAQEVATLKQTCPVRWTFAGTE